MAGCQGILIQAAAEELLSVFRFDMTHNLDSGMYACHNSSMLLALGKGCPTYLHGEFHDLLNP